MLNECFDCVYVINLKRRPDRLVHITNQFKRIATSFKYIEAVDGELIPTNKEVGNGWNFKGVTGCAYSHKKVYVDALSNNYNSILIVEDDNVFSDNFIKEFECYIQQIPCEWDMLYFGGNHQVKNKAINVNAEKITHTLTTNCYAIKTKHLPALIQNLPDNTENLKYPIDVLLAQIQRENNCYAFKPKICWQLEDFSDIENKKQPIPFLKTHNDKASVIISSFNQCKRLKFALSSIIKQDYDNYEVIVADDNSTDGTVEMISENFKGVKISLNKKSKSKKYTLADNWNTAAILATGKRLIFTNGDNLFSSSFVSAHMDTNMKSDIIFGPNERTTEEIITHLGCKNHIDLLKSIKTIERDLRHDDSAYTYNNIYNTWYPWGNNFSIPTEIFNSVGGFPSKDVYGGEEKELLDSVVQKHKTLIKSNKNAYTLHLWHPQFNTTKTEKRQEYSL
jgi:GR25 family glycosyltransferase involved in LPS biosynthesis